LTELVRLRECRQEQELTAQAQVQEREGQRQAINKKLDQLFVN
jgi:hypothetical protein